MGRVDDYRRAYAWSVVVAAAPEHGRAARERLLAWEEVARWLG